ncbi:phosphopantetheine-binding protein [Actinoplanes missouriensis]|uniref:phosphopantetheine-binding protein n=1 Tax=Actinoplanes missouriensis TaxID=1866 RepID=UPI0033E4287E
MDVLAYPTLERILRAQLPALSADATIPPDLPLSTVGLDSVGTVVLMDTVEDIFGVTFPEAAIVPATFRTPASLWAVLEPLTGAGR